MIAPAPDFDNSIAIFNSFTVFGNFLTKQKDFDTIQVLFAEVERYKEVGYAEYYAMKSAYCSLIRDEAGLDSCCVNVKAHTSRDDLICFASQSLIYSGYYSKAYALLSESRINWREPGNAETRLIALCRANAYKKLEEFLAMLVKCNLKISPQVNAMADTLSKARELEIPEASVRNMLDAAGKVTRQKGYSFTQKSIDVIGESLIISLGIKAPPSLVAQMEWDYTGEVVENYPDAPIEKVSIVFFSEEN